MDSMNSCNNLKSTKLRRFKDMKMSTHSKKKVLNCPLHLHTVKVRYIVNGYSGIADY